MPIPMFLRTFIACLLLTSCIGSTIAQTVEVGPTAEAVSTSVPGLKLPNDMNLKGDEGFVIVKAETTGDVKWLVLANVKVRYDPRLGNELIMAIPPAGGTIYVYAVALVDGKMTEFARTTINVQGTSPPPQPPNDQVTASKLNVTAIIDVNKTSPNEAAVLNDANMRSFMETGGHKFRVFNLNSAFINSRPDLQQEVREAGGAPALIYQNEAGKVLSRSKLPGSATEVIAEVKRLTGAK